MVYMERYCRSWRRLDGVIDIVRLLESYLHIEPMATAFALYHLFIPDQQATPCKPGTSHAASSKELHRPHGTSVVERRVSERRCCAA